jgi:hypothetical protein
MPRKVVASTYITLDGYIDEPGEWSFPFWSEEAAQFKARELAASDALLAQLEVRRASGRISRQRHVVGLYVDVDSWPLAGQECVTPIVCRVVHSSDHVFWPRRTWGCWNGPW